MQYIERVNTVEAIQIKGDILKDVIPFLNEHNIEYTLSSGTFEKRSALMVRPTTSFGSKQKMRETKRGDYILVSKMLGLISVAVMSEDDFNNIYQPSSEVLNEKPSDKEEPIEVKLNRGPNTVPINIPRSPQPTVSRDKSNRELEEMINSLQSQWDNSRTAILKLNDRLTALQLERLAQSHQDSTPRFRIELDDVGDEPKLWVDGRRLDLLNRLSLNWNTSMRESDLDFMGK
ncbi:hypothetical protein [Leuconostoc carnosum]|uniref:hypothetical protein n=1 Tax=Leuconostoc carnosum TaxID=1252 RepID=UPI0012395B8D|nr:hypothetical protein [Leuconostoc carnosum]KAA8327797.1 hypothetical protein FE409_07150 [Leuconostoc carnosum]KAA8375262.1 hypothetical protein FE408_07200 [Leuconostoc carnosum]